ncbi:hypothetical protein [Nostoc sp.]|uniref:hypothetical protein n=1 Tax=Nostoc sp. TaxID=1180 RepID=UPI002FF51860
MVKIKASKEGIEEINKKREEEGWTTDQNSEALIITSQQEFKKAVDKITDDTPLTIENIETLATNKIFTSESTNLVWEYINELKNNSLRKIDSEYFVKFIKSKEIHTKGITYRNWKNFLHKERKPIDKDVFIAFCEALGIENWRDVAELPPIERESNNQPNLLKEGLSSFNHKTQIKLLKTNFSNRNKPFLVANTCKYSRTWMLRRLELEIENINRLKCKPFFLSGSRHSLPSINELSSRFERQYPRTRLVESLKRENLLIVIDDPYDCKEIISNFWLPLVEKLTKTKTPGRMFMFLLPNNQANVQQIESTQIIELPPANPFEEKDKEDIVNVLLEIGAKMLKPLSQNDAERIADSLIQKSNGDTLKLLQEIYNHFKCRQTKFADIWQRYP